MRIARAPIPARSGSRRRSLGEAERSRPAAPGGARPHDLTRVPMSAPVQRMARHDDTPAGRIRRAAREGVRTPATPLPFAAAIQRSFGRHSIVGVRAHAGRAAEASASAMEAGAFTTGEHVVLGGRPDLRTVAHEAAHVVQQRAGARPAGGVGRAGDAHERQAEAVADAVVAGRSAEPLLPAGAAQAPQAGSQHPPPGAVVQRVLRINGQVIDPRAHSTPGTVHHRLRRQHRTRRDRNILASWHASSAVHDFTGDNEPEALAKVEEAVDRARELDENPEALFAAANFQFSTKAEGRRPTLYFKSGHESGRLRQQHPSGPMVGRERHKQDYFFKTSERMRRFGRAAKANRANFDPAASGVRYRTAPKQGYYHFEVTYTGPGQSGPVEKRHPSGGTVHRIGPGHYSDARIERIYRRIAGR